MKKIINKKAERYMPHATRLTSKGTTLIELMIYMGLLATVFMVLAQLFGTILDARRESEAVSYTTLDARYIYNRFLYDISNADSVETPANLGDQSSTLQLTKNGVTYVYQLSANNLVVNGVRLNSFNSTISDTTYQRIGNTNGKNTIKITYTVTSNVRKSSGNEVKTVSTTIGLR